MNLRVKNKLVVGLTGSILSGKSTVLKCFAQNGAEVLSADALVHELYRLPAVTEQLIRWFGSCEPREIAVSVFACDEKRKQLENFLHPQVLKLAAEKIKKSTHKLIIFEVPLLFEVGWDQLTDLNMVVVASPATLPARLLERGLSQPEYEKRLATQLPELEKMSRADVVLFNGKDKTDLDHKVKRLCLAFETFYGAN